MEGAASLPHCLWGSCVCCRSVPRCRVLVCVSSRLQRRLGNSWALLGPGLTLQGPECTEGTSNGCLGGQLRWGGGWHEGEEARPCHLEACSEPGSGGWGRARQAVPRGEGQGRGEGDRTAGLHCQGRGRWMWCPGPTHVTLILSVLWQPVPGGPEREQDQGQCLGRRRCGPLLWPG